MACRTSVCVLIALYLSSLLMASVFASQDMTGPPARPKVFKNPDELREYLKALNEYFAIVGRPRFGKRSASEDYRKRSEDSKFQLNGDASSSAAEQDYIRYLLYGYRK